MAVISISRQFGAGGHTLGQLVSERLGYELVEEQVFRRIAEKAGVSLDSVMAVQKEAGSRLMQVLNWLVSSDYINRILAQSSVDFNEEMLLDSLIQVVREVSDADNKVIVGQGAQFILPDGRPVIKVLLVADLDSRIRFLRQKYEVTRKQAQNVIERECRKRALFLNRLDPRDPNDPSAYDVCLNMTELSMQEAEDLVVGMVRRDR
jgi:cytidylate kinase